MPELAEVKLSSEIIKPLVTGKFVTKAFPSETGRYASGNHPEGYKEFTDSFRKLNDNIYVVDSLKVIDVKTKGKFTYWEFDNGFYMLNTFGMSGQWSPIPGKHICFRFKLLDLNPSIDQIFIYFNDPRHFGTIKFINNKQELIDKLNSLGWDALQDKIENYLPFIQSKLKSTSKPIAQVLLDQSVFAGVGNYIRAEALYLAKMSPWRQCNLMAGAEILTLCEAIVTVVKESYAHQGATISTYKTVYGQEGKYSSCFKVYSKKTDPLGNKVIKQETPDKRMIHWCPTIQK